MAVSETPAGDLGAHETPARAENTRQDPTSKLSRQGDAHETVLPSRATGAMTARPAHREKTDLLQDVVGPDDIHGERATMATASRMEPGTAASSSIAVSSMAIASRVVRMWSDASKRSNVLSDGIVLDPFQGLRSEPQPTNKACARPDGGNLETVTASCRSRPREGGREISQVRRRRG